MRYNTKEPPISFTSKGEKEKRGNAYGTLILLQYWKQIKHKLQPIIYL
jgi:hypothetical protein